MGENGYLNGDAVAPSIAGALALPLPPLQPSVLCGTVYRRIIGRPDESTLAVVDQSQRPIGLINRFMLLSRFAQRFIPEIYDRKPVTEMMDASPLVVDEATPIEELGRQVAIERPSALFDGFIVTSQGRYLGIGTGNALIRSKVARDARRTAELRIAFAEAAQARKAMSEFLALMSHELRTPLNAIIGFSDLLRREHFGRLGNPRYVEYAGDIYGAGNHLLSLISDILDLSKAEAGRLEIRPEPMHIAPIVEDCLRLMHRRAIDAGLKLIAELAEDLPMLNADPGKVKQMLLNLVSNAIKFTPAGGYVKVLAATADGDLVLEVADTGIGIAAEDIPTALAPFGQIDSSFSRKTQGTGLGLPLVKTFIELHDGRLTLESQPGQGTTVSLYFPRKRVLAVSGVI